VVLIGRESLFAMALVAFAIPRIVRADERRREQGGEVEQASPPRPQGAVAPSQV